MKRNYFLYLMTSLILALLSSWGGELRKSWLSLAA